MKLIIVRHGETIENANGISMGHIDGTLSDKGLDQVKKLADRLKNEKIDFIYCSDLGRTKETLKEIIKNHPHVPVVYDELLRERGKGVFENHPQDEHRIAREESGLSRFEFRPEGGESFIDVSVRVKKFVTTLIKNHEPNETILIVTHGGWKNAFISYFMNIPYKNEIFYFAFKNTSVSIFELNEDTDHLVHVINCTKHLDAPVGFEKND
jgi:broad specificity phosphatase PhoE